MRTDEVLFKNASDNGFSVTEKSQSLVVIHRETGRKKSFKGCDRYSHAITHIENFTV